MIFNPNATIKIEKVHDVQCLLIDNVFLNPDELRLYAKDSLRPKAILRNVMGYEIHPADIDEHIPNYAADLADTLHRFIGVNISEFFGIDISKATLKAFKGPYFNCVGVNELPNFPPHVDNGHISTFAYLNPPESCAGGTRIFRHIPTNKICVVQKNSTSIQWMVQKPLDKALVESTEEWELVKYFEMKYNRLIAFNSSVIHKIDVTGGKFTMDVDNARLVLNCFFRYVTIP